MSTVYTPGFTFGTGTGAGAGPEKSKDPSATGFYVCELRWNGWSCEKTKDSFVIPQKSNDAFCTRLIPVPNYVPSIFEKSYVSWRVTTQNVHFKQ